MILAQDTDILLLVGLTTFWDLSHRVELLDLLDELQEMKGETIVIILHNLNLSYHYADYLTVRMRCIGLYFRIISKTSWEFRSG